MKKILLLFFIIAFYLYPNTSIDKYLLITFKGSIDKYPISMYIKIINPDSIMSGKTASIIGHYKYDKINTPIKLEGTINKGSMTIKANDNEIFAFTFNEDQLYNIINSKNENYINLNGKWRNNNKYLDCNIRTSKFIHSIYEIYIEKEYQGNEGSIGGIYIEDEGIAIENLESKSTTLNQFIYDLNNSLDETLSNNDYMANLSYTESSRLHSYFDDKIFSIIYYSNGYYGGAGMVHDTVVSIFSINTFNRVNNKLNDLVYDTIGFRNFIKSKIKEQVSNYDYDNFGEYFDERVTSLDYAEIYFNNDASVTINFYFPADKIEYSSIDVNMYELLPYIKNDSFYKYLFIK